MPIRARGKNTQPQKVVLADSESRAEVTEEYWTLDKRIDEHAWLIAENKTLVQSRVKEAIFSKQVELMEMRKLLPKPSEIYGAIDKDNFTSAKELRNSQLQVRKAIRDSEIVKQINKIRKTFPEQDLTCRKANAQSNVASVLIAEDMIRQQEIDAQLGYVTPEVPKLHTEAL